MNHQGLAPSVKYFNHRLNCCEKPFDPDYIDPDKTSVFPLSRLELSGTRLGDYSKEKLFAKMGLSFE